MRTRMPASMGLLAAALVILSLAPATTAGQSQTVPLPPNLMPEPGWTAPRTPWGDPNIQGSFTNLYEAGTPFERPDEYQGRQINEISREELTQVRREIQARTREQWLAGEIGGARWWWLDSHDHERGGSPWFVVDPPDGKIPPVTARGQARIAARQAARRGRGPADSYEDRSLYDRCITRGLPGSMLPAIYGNSYQIVQTPGYVAIRYEMIHETRVIPLDGGAHLAPTLRSHLGDARGRWEGDTLVVETTNFAEGTTYRDANHETLRLIERFTRVAPDKVRWMVRVDDLETWERPWTFAMNLTEDDSEPLFEYACHEGNYAMQNILSAARAEERTAAEQARRQPAR